jgi:dipeptide transport system substrate-binding protein
MDNQMAILQLTMPSRCRTFGRTNGRANSMSRWLIIACSAALTLAAGAARADSLVVCTEASPDALDANHSTANTSFDVSEQTSDRLVEMEIGGSHLLLALAESWTISDEGLRYTFKLRHGVKWRSAADAVKLTACPA